MDKIVKLCARRATAHLAAALFTAIVTTPSARAAEFIPLGSLPGERFSSRAMGVSDDGNVVVGFSNGGFVWTRETGMQSIDNVIGVEGLQFNVEDVSGDGSTFVGNYLHGMFRWSEAAGLFVIEHDNQEDGPFHMAESISADGSAFVGYSFDSILDRTEAFRYSDADGLQPLGYLPGGGVESQALDISADGSVVVGFSDSANSEAEAFRWQGAQMDPLEEQIGMGLFSRAEAISPDGSVIVGSRDGRALRWNQEMGIELLPELPGGISPNIAWDVSRNGSTIIGNTLGDGAFIWTEESGSQFLDDVLRNDLDLSDSLSGWTGLFALAVSANGQHIVGTGRNPDNNAEAWLVTIPEPASAASVIVAVVFALFHTRRMRR